MERVNGFGAQSTYATLEKLREQHRVLKINVFNNVIIINYCNFLFFTHSIAIRKGTSLNETKFPFLKLTFFFFDRIFHVGKCVYNLPETLAFHIKIEWAQF